MTTYSEPLGDGSTPGPPNVQAAGVELRDASSPHHRVHPTDLFAEEQAGPDAPETESLKPVTLVTRPPAAEEITTESPLDEPVGGAQSTMTDAPRPENPVKTDEPQPYTATAAGQI